MFGAGIFFAICLVFIIIKATVTKPASVSQYDDVASTGIAGRGILLEVSSANLGNVGVGMYRMQQRSVTIDIELPGQPPYVATLTALIPMNLVRDVMPGATVEVRVDQSNPNNVMIVGPGVGFNSNTLLTQGQTNQGAA